MLVKFWVAKSPPVHVYAAGDTHDRAAIADPPESASAPATTRVPRTPSRIAFPMSTNPSSHGPPKGADGPLFYTPAPRRVKGDVQPEAISGKRGRAGRDPVTTQPTTAPPPTAPARP